MLGVHLKLLPVETEYICSEVPNENKTDFCEQIKMFNSDYEVFILGGNRQFNVTKLKNFVTRSDLF